jgi:hypothetical protein
MKAVTLVHESKRAGRQGSTPQNSRTAPVRSMPSRTATHQTHPPPTALIEILKAMA